MEFQSLTNQFLIAMPALQDDNFAKTVSLVCQHDENGSMGLIINRPISGLSLAEILNQLNIEIDEKAPAQQIGVYSGGPVHPELGMVLHHGQGEWESTLRIGDDFGLTTSIDIIQAIAGGEGPGQCMFILGYSGWSAGQLEYEIQQNAWLNAPSNSQIIFHTPIDKRWKSSAAQLGIDITTLSSDAGHA
ncbi:MAG: putative transcriptional regulator [Parasphingorhabdus sp.]|jgi:putative transcriptional regulator